MLRAAAATIEGRQVNRDLKRFDPDRLTRVYERLFDARQHEGAWRALRRGALSGGGLRPLRIRQCGRSPDPADEALRLRVLAVRRFRYRPPCNPPRIAPLTIQWDAYWMVETQ